LSDPVHRVFLLRKLLAAFKFPEHSQFIPAGRAVFQMVFRGHPLGGRLGKLQASNQAFERWTIAACAEGCLHSCVFRHCLLAGEFRLRRSMAAFSFRRALTIYALAPLLLRSPSSRVMVSRDNSSL